MRHTIPRIALWSALLALMLLVGGMSSAMATEYSIWEWWTNNYEPGSPPTTGGMVDSNGLPITPPWGNAYNLATTADLWSVLSTDSHELTRPEGTFTSPNGGQFWLEAEWAGNCRGNSFGWYQPTGSIPGAGQMHTIFGGGAVSGAYETERLNAQAFGFYLSGAGGTFYSETNLNGFNTGTTDPNDHYRQVRIFQSPDDVTNRSFILAWEDLAIAANGTSAYANAWADPNTLMGTHDPDDDPVNRRTYEPDYNDMILKVTVHPTSGTDTEIFGTPELSTWALLACTALFGMGYMKKRRTV